MMAQDSGDRLVRLSDVSRRLRVDYQRPYRHVISGRLPAERGAGDTLWLVRESDLPAIAAALGVEPPAAA